MDRKTFAWGAAAGTAGTLVLLAVAGLLYVYSGAFNVAATSGHDPFTRWVLETTRENSVDRRADRAVAPPYGSADLQQGYRLFSQACEHCHGAPGVDPAPWAQSMVPDPPPLSHAAEEWNVAEIYWIVKHGIKMSGMPSFASATDDRALWNVAAFVERLPAITAAEYRALGDGTPSGHVH